MRIVRLSERSWLERFWLFAMHCDYYMELYTLDVYETLIAYELCKLDFEARAQADKQTEEGK
jgi:hypothetical protein